jgi:hypothetical protein
MANPLIISRDQLEKFLPNHETIRSFEQLLKNVSIDTPESISEANNNASTAIALATAALSTLADVITALDYVLSSPVLDPLPEDENLIPPSNAGSLAEQDADDVDITGGAIAGASGAFTTISASAAVTLSPANANVVISPTGTGVVTIAPATAGTINNASIGATTPQAGRFTSVTVPGGAQFITTNTALNNGAGASAGTITNAPSAGNPTKWVGINDNGTIRYIPAW